MTDGQDNKPRPARGAAAGFAAAAGIRRRSSGTRCSSYSPDGKLLMTLGTAGGAREPDYFYQPNDVLVAPNGDIFVSEGHASTEGSNARVLKFDKSGKFLKSWGKFGKGPREFDQPHALAMDSKGRLFVGDRGNNRIQIFDQDGKLPAGVDAVQPPERHRHRPASDNDLRRRLGVGLGESAARRVDARHPHRQRQGRLGERAFIPTRGRPAREGQRPTPEAPCASNTSAAEGDRGRSRRESSTARKSGHGRSRSYVKK